MLEKESPESILKQEDSPVDIRQTESLDLKNVRHPLDALDTEAVAFIGDRSR